MLASHVFYSVLAETGIPGQCCYIQVEMMGGTWVAMSFGI